MCRGTSWNPKSSTGVREDERKQEEITAEVTTFEIKEDINTKSTQWGSSDPSRQKKVTKFRLPGMSIFGHWRHLQPDFAFLQEVMTNFPFWFG